ncbi:DUF2946 domain-containing protein [Bordetella petrii]|nr:DUF2946 domain-containing protein [Bordetella petrii]
MSCLAHRRPSHAMRTHTLLWLLALATLFRALVPVGYMPDAAALRQGRFEISFCSAAGGAPTVLQALIDVPRRGDHSPDATAQECPFWMVAHQALDLPPVAVAAALPAMPGLAAPLPVVSRSLPPLPPAGPPLGPRAPPNLPA